MVLEQTIYKRAIFAGRFSELMTFENGLKIGFNVEKRKKVQKGSKKALRLDNFVRAKRKIKHLAWANSGAFKSFITLTYAENFKDIDLSNKNLNVFQMRLKRAYPNIQFLGVMEFQKRGAIHYHFLCSEFIPADKLSDLWGQGFVKINKIKNQQNLGQYIVKYMTKELYSDNRFFMKKKYFYSRNLKKPIVLINKNLIDKIFNLAYNSFIVVKQLYSNNLKIDFVGKIQYQLFSVDYLSAS